MDKYCVVLCGLQARAPDEAAAWQPVAAALKLDHAEFERRVLAVLPRIVRHDLDQASAERIAQLLQALRVDARVLPDDPHLVYIERAGASCGPLPQSSLGDFIQPGESYRVRGDTTWQPWPDSVELDPAAAAVGFGAVDDATPSASTGDETVNEMSFPPPTDVTVEAIEPLADEPPTRTDDEPDYVTPASPSADAADQSSDIAQGEAAANADAELARAMPPLLGSASAAAPSSPPESVFDTAATAPEPDVEVLIRDDGLVKPSRETLSSDLPKAFEPTTSNLAEAAAPKRSHTGWLVMLVVLIALAIWAYHYWTASTDRAAPPAAASTIQPSGAHSGQSTPPARVVPGDSPSSLVAAPASVAAMTPVPAPAATASAPATAGSTSAASATTAMPPAAASSPAPVTSDPTPATASSSNLPGSAGTVISAQPVPAAAASTAVPATPAH